MLRNVDWTESMVSVGLTRAAIKHSPPYDSAAPLDREQEAGIHTQLWAHRLLASRGETRASRIQIVARATCATTPHGARLPSYRLSKAH
jgi:hypothetical protein